MIMKKIVLATLLAVLTVCAFTLTACNGDSDRLNEDSEIISATVTALDGYKFELNAEQASFVADKILRAGEFESDSRTSLVGWEFDYDYRLTFKVMKKKFLFKKEEESVSYAFGTTKTRTDLTDTQHTMYCENEWTSFSSLTGSRSIAESDEENAAAVRQMLEGIIGSERQQRYDAIKAQFVAEGFTVRDLSDNELMTIPNPSEAGTFVVVDATQGFEASKESTGESFKIFYTTVEKAKNVYGKFFGKNCRKDDAFVGCGTITQPDSILDRVFAAD